MIAVTTCNRVNYLRRCLPLLAYNTIGDSRLAILVSLDGADLLTRQFCDSWEVPLLYSDTREGVGLAKNRVLEQFPDFDYYFFLEDDVELVDGGVFADHIALAHGLGVHHMSLFEPRAIRQPISRATLLGHDVVYCAYGSADFNFFTRTGLQRVGGWDLEFARYRRWGHTEHSYRFARAGLTPAPFIIAPTLARACVWHAPASVTRAPEVKLDEDHIAQPERSLMAQQLTYVPLQTIAPYHHHGPLPGPLKKLATALDGGRRYPLLAESEQQQARVEFLVWKLRNASRLRERLTAGVTAGLLQPSNPEWRHEVKMRLRRSK